MNVISKTRLNRLRGTSLSRLLAGVLLLAASPGGQAQELGTIRGDWEATDALGRRVPDFAQVGPPRADRFVAIFYWTWHIGGDVETGTVAVDPLVKQYPEAINDYDNTLWKPYAQLSRHHWNQPLFGYYRSTDPWVLRRHAEMLADAGVDVVVFDCTNGTFTWKPAYEELARVWTQTRHDGVNTPKIAFLCPFGPWPNSRTVIQNLYDDIYRPGRFKELWFYWKGKPLIMGYPDNIDPEVAEFFTFRPGDLKLCNEL